MPADPAIPTDEELARAAQAGSMESFEELVRRYETRLYRFLARASRNDADGADLTQETFVTAHAKLDRFDSAQSFATWLFTIARRKCIDLIRTRRPSDEVPLPEEADHDSPAELLARRDEQSDLWRRVRAALPERSFQALWLMYVEGMSVAEIATILGLTGIHVKVILFRARARLADILDSSGESDSPPNLLDSTPSSNP